MYICMCVSHMHIRAYIRTRDICMRCRWAAHWCVHVYLCVHVCTYMRVYHTCTYIHTSCDTRYTHALPLDSSLVRAYVMYFCMHIQTHTSIHTYTRYKHALPLDFSLMFVCVYVCVCMYSGLYPCQYTRGSHINSSHKKDIDRHKHTHPAGGTLATTGSFAAQYAHSISRVSFDRPVGSHIYTPEASCVCKATNAPERASRVAMAFCSGLEITARPPPHNMHCARAASTAVDVVKSSWSKVK
jgi:hypothetical protein